MDKFSVGDTVYYFDENRRIYRREDGMSGRPIYREHFRPVVIVDEVAKSWVLNVMVTIKDRSVTKVSKATAETMFFTAAEVDRAVWVEENAFRIRSFVRDCDDYETLRAIDAVIQEHKLVPALSRL